MRHLQPHLSFIFLCFAFSVSIVSAQNAPTVTQSCLINESINANQLPVYRTYCSEDDQHGISLTFNTNKSDIKVYDGDNDKAPLISNDQVLFKSSKLCLTIKIAEQPITEAITIAGNCIPLDRSKWPVYQAKGKE